MSIEARTRGRPLHERFWEKVNKNGPVHPVLGTRCWLWTASTRSHGRYGQIGSGGKRGAVLDAHRVAWTLAHGPIPVGLHVLHKCDVTRCCNVAHLFLGTNDDNMQDKIRKGRQSMGADYSTTRLDSDAVSEIRRAHVAGESSRSIAARLGRGRTTIRAVIEGRTWRTT